MDFQVYNLLANSYYLQFVRGSIDQYSKCLKFNKNFQIFAVFFFPFAFSILNKQKL